MAELIKAKIYKPACNTAFVGAVSEFLSLEENRSLNSAEYFIFPGFCDVHVHFRDPGFIYKEDTKTGSLAAARGGYTAVCTMPNLKPVPDSLENLRVQLDIIEKTAKIRVKPYGSITKGEMGYTDVNDTKNTPEQNRKLADGHNAEMGVSKTQENAMVAGSMFGWNVPGADPKNYDEYGTPIKKRTDSREER